MPSRCSVEERKPSPTNRTKTTRYRVRWLDPDTAKERSKHFPTRAAAEAFRDNLRLNDGEAPQSRDNGHRAARARQVITARPAPTTGPYGHVCPACQAQSGEWCEAVFNLPGGTLLRDPHDARRALA